LTAAFKETKEEKKLREKGLIVTYDYGKGFIVVHSRRNKILSTNEGGGKKGGPLGKLSTKKGECLKIAVHQSRGERAHCRKNLFEGGNKEKKTMLQKGISKNSFS